jgi:ABC-type transport system involved in cytochrome c biogenesis permease subunit
MNSTLWYNICIIGYVAALFIYIGNLAFKRAVARRLATVLVALAFLTQTLGMVFRWLEAGDVEVAAVERTTGVALTGLARFMVFTQHPPWSNLYEIMVYMSWGIVLVFLVSEIKFRIRFLGIFALMLTLAALGVASLTDGVIKPLVPALKSWWIMIHVISASIAYAAGTLAAVASLLYLVKAKERMPMTLLASGVMGVSALLGLILGRGGQLLTEATYKVKLLKRMGDEFMVVGKAVDDKIMPYYVVSPGVGVFLLVAVLLCVVSMFMLYRAHRRSDLPSGVAKVSYFAATLAMVWVGCAIVFNDLTQTNVMPPHDVVAELLPGAPWTLGLRSNAWDLGLLGIILVGQIFVGLAILFPTKIRGLLPDVNKLDRLAYSNVMVAFALVAVVLVTGALWAHYAWGRYWGWDPKETGALVIWITYALYLHTRVTYGWTGTRSATIGIFGFFVILAGFLGVNLGWFADGLHSYGSA